jgi:nucleoside-diphosphate-sugar epimerase
MKGHRSHGGIGVLALTLSSITKNSPWQSWIANLSNYAFFPLVGGLAFDLIGGPVVHVPKRPGEPDCTWADTSKIERMLGWKPRINAEQGISSTLRWYRTQRWL